MELFKREDSKFWWCDFSVTDSTGKKKRIKKSTKETVKKKAQEVAHQLAKDYKDAPTSGHSQSQGILDLLRDASNYALDGALNLERGQEILNKMVSLSTGKTLSSYSVRSWCDFWLDNRTANIKPSTAKTYKGVITKFLSFLDYKAEDKLQNLTAQDILDFRDSIIENGRTARTANQNLKAIRSCLEQARKQGYVPRNVAEAVDNLIETDSSERAPFTAKEIKALVDHAPSQDWKGLILLASLTGLRQGDAVSVKWGNIDFQNEVIHIMPSKTDRKRKKLVIPIHRHLMDFIEGHTISDDPEAFIFPSLAQKKSGGRDGLSKKFSEIMEKAKVAKISVRLREDGASKEMNAKSFHSLRHSFVSLMANNDVSQEHRKKLAGHASDRMNDIYTSFETDALKDAVNSIKIY